MHSITIAKRIPAALLIVGWTLLLAPASAAAQPFDGYVEFDRLGGHGYIEVPSHPDFLPLAVTWEFWLNPLEKVSSCASLIGKNFNDALWIGLCSDRLRVYMDGSRRTASDPLPTGLWQHIAVTSDGVRRKFYLNGSLVEDYQETVDLSATNDDPLRFGSDVPFTNSPAASMDEVRLWKVARSQSQIQSTMNQTIDAPQTDLVAVWHLDGNANDALGVHHGTIEGAASGLHFLGTGDCQSTNTQYCLQSDRFSARVEWQANGETGDGRKVPGAVSDDSGLFWFFAEDNWEMLVKVIDGCSLTNTFWVFAAATTDVAYTLTVTDHETDQVRQYVNAAGVASPAITDTGAFATCP